MRVGNPASASAPNSASGRLLPVDVKPGTRQSLTVFHHLDGHRPYQLRLTLIEWRAMKHLTQRPHHTLDLTRLEEIDSAERRLGVREQPLQIVHRGRRTLAAGRLERPLLVAARERQLIQHEEHTSELQSHGLISYAVF